MFVRLGAEARAPHGDLDDVRYDDAAHGLALPEQVISHEVLLEKYAKGDERSADDVRARVCPRALAAVEAPAARTQWEARFFDAQSSGFIPAGRIDSAAGTAARGHADQLLRAAGGRLDRRAPTTAIPASTSRSPKRPRPCAAAAAWATTSRASAPAAPGSARTQSQRLGAGELHARVRPLLRDGGVGRRRAAARRWACCAATTPTSRSSSTPRTHGDLTNFNISVGVTDAFMQRGARTTREVELVHRAEPGAAQRRPVRRAARADGAVGLPRAARARAVGPDHAARPTTTPSPACCSSTASTADNNLGYCETHRLAPTPAASSRCRPTAAAASARSTSRASCDDAVRARRALSTTTRFVDVVEVAVRMLDNVLDVTVWPLPQQHDEARAKRRVGLGFTGLGDALVMLGLRYDTRAGARDGARASPKLMRDAAYDASVDLARERGAFPLFNADLYLSRGSFASRLPQRAEGHDPRARPAQLAPAVDRAHRHHQPGLRRQREQRHRAGRSAGATRARSAMPDGTLQGVRGRGPRVAAVPPPEGRRRAADRRPSSPRSR